MNNSPNVLNRNGFATGFVGLLLTGGLLLNVAAYGETMEEKLKVQVEQEKKELAAAEEKRQAEKNAKAAAAKAAQKEKDRKAAAAEKKAQEEAARKAAARAQAKRDAAAAKEAEAKANHLAAEQAKPEPPPVVIAEPPASRPAADNSPIIKPDMRPIPGGTFTMGCVDGRDNVEGVATCIGDEMSAHQVTLNAFQMARTETTVAQYMACVDAGACPPPEWKEANAPDYYKNLGAGLSGSDYPIVGVSWNNANAYAKWLSKETGKSYRLPTEAEWEYAARGGTDTAYPWGSAIGKGNANCHGDCCGDKFDYTAPVGSFAANGYGLHDMNGNVWEWCQDWYAGDYYASSPASNPKGAASGTDRVLRGGSLNDNALHVRSASRLSLMPVNRYGSIGFRLVLP